MNTILATVGESSGLFITAGLLILGLCLFIIPFVIVSKLGAIERQMKASNKQALAILRELQAMHSFYAVANPEVEEAWRRNFP